MPTRRPDLERSRTPTASPLTLDLQLCHEVITTARPSDLLVSPLESLKTRNAVFRDRLDGTMPGQLESLHSKEPGPCPTID